MDIATRVAIWRFKYHANMTSVVNVLNQLGILSDEKAEEKNKHHIMTIVNDISPRLNAKAIKELENWGR